VLAYFAVQSTSCATKLRKHQWKHTTRNLRVQNIISSFTSLLNYWCRITSRPTSTQWLRNFSRSPYEAPGSKHSTPDKTHQYCNKSASHPGLNVHTFRTVFTNQLIWRFHIKDSDALYGLEMQVILCWSQTSKDQLWNATGGTSDRSACC
jgi:hypothetical protein